MKGGAVDEDERLPEEGVKGWDVVGLSSRPSGSTGSSSRVPPNVLPDATETRGAERECNLAEDSPDERILRRELA